MVSARASAHTRSATAADRPRSHPPIGTGPRRSTGALGSTSTSAAVAASRCAVRSTPGRDPAASHSTSTGRRANPAASSSVSRGQRGGRPGRVGAGHHHRRTGVRRAATPGYRGAPATPGRRRPRSRSAAARSAAATTAHWPAPPGHRSARPAAPSGPGPRSPPGASQDPTDTASTGPHTCRVNGEKSRRATSTASTRPGRAAASNPASTATTVVAPTPPPAAHTSTRGGGASVNHDHARTAAAPVNPAGAADPATDAGKSQPVPTARPVRPRRAAAATTTANAPPARPARSARAARRWLVRLDLLVGLGCRGWRFRCPRPPTWPPPARRAPPPWGAWSGGVACSPWPPRRPARRPAPPAARRPSAAGRWRYRRRRRPGSTSAARAGRSPPVAYPWRAPLTSGAAADPAALHTPARHRWSRGCSHGSTGPTTRRPPLPVPHTSSKYGGGPIVDTPARKTFRKTWPATMRRGPAGTAGPRPAAP